MQEQKADAKAKAESLTSTIQSIAKKRALSLNDIKSTLSGADSSSEENEDAEADEADETDETDASSVSSSNEYVTELPPQAEVASPRTPSRGAEKHDSSSPNEPNKQRSLLSKGINLPKSTHDKSPPQEKKKNQHGRAWPVNFKREISKIEDKKRKTAAATNEDQVSSALIGLLTATQARLESQPSASDRAADAAVLQAVENQATELRALGNSIQTNQSYIVEGLDKLTRAVDESNRAASQTSDTLASLLTSIHATMKDNATGIKDLARIMSEK